MDQQSPRRRARELALKALYASEIGGGEPSEVLNEMLGKEKLATKACELARLLVTRTAMLQQWADRTISACSENWKIERFAVIDRIILRMALTEIREIPDVPKNVVINEAIELAKSYSTEKSASFINGVLDNCAIEKEDKASETGLD